MHLNMHNDTFPYNNHLSSLQQPLNHFPQVKAVLNKETIVVSANLSGMYRLGLRYKQSTALGKDWLFQPRTWVSLFTPQYLETGQAPHHPFDRPPERYDRDNQWGPEGAQPILPSW